MGYFSELDIQLQEQQQLQNNTKKETNMITRQHFEAFAKEINAIDSQIMRQEFSILSARIFEHFSPNFNRCKYLEACGYYTGKKQHKYENVALNREIA